MTPTLIGSQAVLDLRTALAEDPKLADLPGTMDAIQQAVTKWWEKDYMPWFTDHGPKHSQRVAEYALLISTIPNLGPASELTALERYILFAAAWLHDIGMQDLLSQGRLGELDAGGYTRVRHDHPTRTCDNILSRPEQLGLPVGDSPLVEAVAYVARAHGTKTYKDSITTLRDLALVRNKSARGPLLGALLLMADELDLHYERSRPLPGRAELNVVSQAHAFKHKCVTGVATSISDSGDISIELTLTFPKGMTSTQTDIVERWITVKLRTQMGMVEPELIEGFRGQARFSRSIKVSRRTALTPDEPIGPEVFAVIRADVITEELIDHRHRLRQLIDRALANSIVLVTGRILGRTHVDVDGREDALSAALAQLVAEDVTVRSCDRALIPASMTAADVIADWLAPPTQLNGDVPAAVAVEKLEESFEESRRSTLLERLTDDLTKAGTAFVFGLSSLDALSVPHQKWLISNAIPHLRSAATCAFLMTTSPEAVNGWEGPAVVTIPMGELDRQDVLAFLGRYVSQAVAMGEWAAGHDYTGFRRVAQGHEKVIRGEVAHES